MAIQTINIGTSANKGNGDPLRTAFKKINENFAELDVTNSNRDINGSVFADDSTLLVDAVNGTITAAVLVGTLPALNGSNLTDLTIPAQTFASLTSKPTTVAGYGITDAATAAQGALAATALQAETITLPELRICNRTNLIYCLLSGPMGCMCAYVLMTINNVNTCSHWPLHYMH